jgi:hypothetical protein
MKSSSEENETSDTKTNVVPLKPATVSREGWCPREQEALLLARLGALPALEYERVRVPAAKELKCRVSWLDKVIENIHVEAAKFADFPPAKDEKTSVGHPIKFIRDDGSEVMSFLVVSAHKNGQDRHIVVLADGNATVINSIPLTDDQIARLKSRLSPHE